MQPTEIWVVSGRHPVLWTIPFSVWYPTPKTVEMMSAIPLLPMQEEAVANRLMNFAERDDLKRGLFRTNPTQLQLVAEQSVGNALVDHLFCWGPRPKRVFTEDQEETKEDREDFDAFLDSLFLESGIGNSRSELEFLWIQFCKHAQYWLINEERPVDMLFIKLHPTPFRANWMQVLLSRMPRRWKPTLTRHDFREEYVVDEEVFLNHLLSPDLLAINQTGHYCYRRVEVEYRKPWWKNTQKVEKARMGLVGVYGYAVSVFNHVKRFLPAAVRIYGSFIAQIARPCPRVLDGEHPGDFRFLPGKTIRTLPSMRHLGPIRQPPTVFARLTRPPSSGKSKNLLIEDVPLPAMPVVQPKIEDVRDVGGEVSKPGDDGHG